MMHLIPYYIYKKAAMLKKKRKQCPYKPSSVPAPRKETGACHLSSPRVTPGLKHSTLHSSPKAIGRAALNLRFT